ncbi:MAG: electron transport complex subunit RsxG [Betaproteobacteria bacterium]|nr:MAG: electron transport complex subunit RsxG [Betaproteobacteria bacterium]
MSSTPHWTRDILQPAAVLVVFSAISAFLLFGTHSLTAPAIARAERALKNSLLAQTLPADRFDNDLSQAERPLATDPLLGLKRPGSYFVATLKGQPSAVILEASAPDGYAGEIKLLISILADGRLGGVRVASHHETPGLADFIEAKRSPWIQQFNGKSLQQPSDSGWKVKKDGGQFDAVAGATVTPRAIVKAAHRALRYFEQHRATLLTPETAP